MGRQSIAYLLIALAIVGLGAAIARALYYSRDRTIERQRRKDRGRWARQGEEDESSGPG